MGLNRIEWKFTEKHFVSLLNGDYKGKHLLELGCQELKYAPLKKKVKQEGEKKYSAKSFFKFLGFKCVSVDKIKCFASTYLDLRKPIPDKLINKFDVVLNYGTTEHIWPRKYQYECFKNIHDAAKVGAIIIHVVPGVRKHVDHSRICYSDKFFSTLSKLNNYKVIEINNRLIGYPEKTFMGACLIKKEDNVFNSSRDKFFKNIIKVDKKKFMKYNNNRSFR